MSDFNINPDFDQVIRYTTRFADGALILKAGGGKEDENGKITGGFSSFPTALLMCWGDLGGGVVELALVMLMLSKIWIKVEPGDDPREEGRSFYKPIATLASEIQVRQNTLVSALRTLENRGYISVLAKGRKNQKFYSLAGCINALSFQIRLSKGEKAGDMLREFGITIPENISLAATVAQINEFFNQDGFRLNWAEMKPEKWEKAIRTKRKVRTVHCVDCGEEIMTSAPNTLRCKPCKDARNLERLYA